MRLIGLTGHKGSGKSSLAGYLSQDYDYEIFSFAEPIKNMLAGLYHDLGVDPDAIEEKLYGKSKETPCPWLGGKTPRYAVQTLGTEWGRSLIWEDLWSQRLHTFIEFSEPDAKIVIDDVRLPREMEIINNLDGMVVRVNRPGLVLGDTHATEAIQFEAYINIDNGGDLSDLREAAGSLDRAFSEG